MINKRSQVQKATRYLSPSALNVHSRRCYRGRRLINCPREGMQGYKEVQGNRKVTETGVGGDAWVCVCFYMCVEVRGELQALLQVMSHFYLFIYFFACFWIHNLLLACILASRLEWPGASCRNLPVSLFRKKQDYRPKTTYLAFFFFKKNSFELEFEGLNTGPMLWGQVLLQLSTGLSTPVLLQK